MVQSFLNFVNLWPYLAMAVMAGGALWATWIIRQLTAKRQLTNYYKHHSGQVFRKLAKG